MPASRRMHAVLFAPTIFLSAFLLFQVQPLLSKFILPWFGGTPAVWTTCMLFFQTLLFAGYAYAHFLTQRFTPRWQAIVHLVMLLAAAVSCPIAPSDAWKPAGDEDPTTRILLLLSASVGLPFFVLSATGPLLQSWFSRVRPLTSPYRLYALSNIGSLLALLSYPFLFEPVFDTVVQSHIWTWGFFAFGALCALTAFGMSVREGRSLDVRAQPHAAAGPPVESLRPTWGVRLLWFSLAMTASILLLATTNQVCMDVASVPFLWVLPLTIYLMTFILCFDSDRWYSRKWFAAALLVSLACVTSVMIRGAGDSLISQVLIYFAGLFFCAMVCHGELVRLKPSAEHLTSFYLVISAGGAAGGLFVGVLAPLVFPIYLEMHAALLLMAALALIVYFRDPHSPLHRGKPRVAWAGLLLAFFVLTSALAAEAVSHLDRSLEVSRNFYGVLRVQEISPDDPGLHHLRLMHGQIEHGLQFIHPKKRMEPTTYYGRPTGVGMVLDCLNKRKGPLHVGVVGLGVGTVAAYARPGDRYRFYEINTEVTRLAETHFTFLSGCRGEVAVVTGDARQSLEREPPQRFDVLAVDAFSGDAIPTHLLTREAFDVYRRHVKPDGVIAFHISNLYFDLRGVISAETERMGWQAVFIDTDTDKKTLVNASRWMILARTLDCPEFRKLRKAGRPYDGSAVEWTDARNNLVEILK